MSEAPLFSVVITTWRNTPFLKEALDSVFAQSIQDFEIVLVVDGVTPPADLPEDPRLRLVVREVNGGFPAALNTAREQVRGRYVAVLDDDDFYEPDRLELGLRGMERAPVAICWRGNPNTGRVGRNRVLEGNVHDVILDAPIPTLGQTTVRREVLLDFDERLRNSCDVDWWIRMSAEHQVTTEPKVGLWLRRHDARNSRNFAPRFRARALIYDKHRAYFDAHPRAAARFLERTSYFALVSGQRREAREYLRRALRLRPKPMTMLRLVRACLPALRRGSGTTQSSP